MNAVSVLLPPMNTRLVTERAPYILNRVLSVQVISCKKEIKLTNIEIEKTMPKVTKKLAAIAQARKAKLEKRVKDDFYF